MKKIFILPFIIALIIFSCTLLDPDTDIAGIYLYTGAFFSQQLFVDSLDIHEGDEIITAGAIVLSWNAFQSIEGDEIIVEKSIGNEDDFTEIKAVPVSRNGTYTDSILSGNTYYYRISLKDGNTSKSMNTYEIIVPQLYFLEPDIANLSVPSEDFDIVYNDVNPDGTYKIVLKDTNNNELWETTSEDTSIVYTGSALSTNIYILEVSTTISDIIESQSVVITTGLTQFFVQ